MNNMRKFLVVASLFAMNSVRAEEAVASKITCDNTCVSLLKAAAFGAGAQVVSNATENFADTTILGGKYAGYVNGHLFALPSFVAAIAALEKVQGSAVTKAQMAAIVAGWLTTHAARHLVSETKYLTWASNSK